MKKLLLVFLFVFGSIACMAQQAKLDSLLRLNAGYANEDERKLDILNSLTTVYGSMQLDSMLVYSDKSLALAKRLGSQKGLGDALNNKGFYLLVNDKTIESKQVYLESITVNKGCNNTKGLGWAYLGIATVYKWMDDFEKYKVYTEKAMQEFSRINDIHGISNAYLWLGTYYLKGNDSSKVKEYHQKALAGFKSIGDIDNVAFTLQFLALTYGQSLLKDSAMNYLQESLAISQKTNNRRNLISAYTDLGAHYTSTANYPMAVYNYLRSIRCAEEMGDDVTVQMLLSCLVSMYCDLKEYENALHYLRKQFARALKIDNKYELRRCHLDFAEVYVHQNKYRDALEHLDEVQKLNKVVGDSLIVYAVDYFRGVAYEGLGQYDSAYIYYHKALDYHKKNENLSGHPKYFLAIAGLLKKIPKEQIRGELLKTISPTNKFNQAIEYANRALSLSEKAGMLGTTRDALLMLSELYELQHNMPLSFQYFKYYTAMKDSIMNTESVKSVANLQIQYETEKKEQQITLLNKDNELQTKELDKQKLVRNSFVAGFGVMLLFAGLFLFQRNKITKEKTRSDGLLLNILPAEVAEELKSKGTADAKHFDNVTVLFTDFKSFTKVSEQLSPQELVDELHTCFKGFDEIMAKYSIEKIKTIGDAYLAVSGLPQADENHAEHVVRAALEIREFMEKRRENLGAKTFEIRIGINSGSVVAGIVGVKKFAYDIWGDTVNTAARMEQNSEAGKINISETTYALVKDKFTCEYRGEIDAKNKGKLAMYFVEAANS